MISFGFRIALVVFGSGALGKSSFAKEIRWPKVDSFGIPIA
jgi:hypothetical protein